MLQGCCPPLSNRCGQPWAGMRAVTAPKQVFGTQALRRKGHCGHISRTFHPSESTGDWRKGLLTLQRQSAVHSSDGHCGYPRLQLRVPENRQGRQETQGFTLKRHKLEGLQSLFNCAGEGFSSTYITSPFKYIFI